MLMCAALCACQSPKHKSTQAIVSDSVSSEYVATCLPDENRLLVHSDAYRCDTVIGDIHITYTLQESGDMVCTYPYVERITSDTTYMEMDTVYYAGQSCIFSIKDSKKIIFQRTLGRDFFAAFIPQSDLPHYMITGVRLRQYDPADGKIYFEVMLCVPDTDICYSFLLIVSAQGDWVVQEELEEESSLFSMYADSICETNER